MCTVWREDASTYKITQRSVGRKVDCENEHTKGGGGRGEELSNTLSKSSALAVRFPWGEAAVAFFLFSPTIL